MTGIVDDFKNAFRKQNNGLVQIILINVVIFLVMVTLFWIFKAADKREYFMLLEENLYLPGDIKKFLFHPWTLITYFFVHSLEGPFHILFNMLFLYWFGKLIDEYLGSRRLVNLYILGGFAGGISYLILANLIPGFSNSQLLGASGAVYAVVVGAATLMPNYTFFLFLLGPVKIKYIAGFYIITSYISLAVNGENMGGNIAHLGGGLMGFLFITQLNNGNDLGRPISRFLEWVKGLFQSKPKMKVTYRSTTTVTTKATSPTYSGTPDDDEIDAILDKINRSGYESLTKEEKQKLFRASQKN
ncbi:rhomboid family intramembrane serine protease [Cytophagaceae bacterium YF14B1]|uniref:Rhomboid family intramembrane serine protease n=1 Tax=Xanthocytophaga flava TaxID=3048013 RepID=A0AAE3QME0_9BACT|nr:rhomboid family intramembrane serine protease [Xanthocytophaga flavus]MDJ1481341.1 rhomboid family intramembrane serine protease [Xanthocytophaga flavus]